MRAAVYSSYGPPEVVRIADVDKPAPKDDEILIRVRATTVCAADWRLRSATPYVTRFIIGLLRPRKPMIGGMELAGVVESAGKSVTRFRAGDGTDVEVSLGDETAPAIVKPLSIFDPDKQRPRS